VGGGFYEYEPFVTILDCITVTGANMRKRLACVLLATLCGAPAFGQDPKPPATQDDKLQAIADRLTAIEKQVTALSQALERATAAIRDEIKPVHDAAGLPRILGIKWACSVSPGGSDQRCATSICNNAGYKGSGTAISYEPTSPPTSPATFVVTGVACRP